MKRRIIIVLALLALASVYFTGTLDRLLYPVGLNFKTCARNGFGATFCGQELDEYNERLGRVREQLQRISR